MHDDLRIRLRAAALGACLAAWACQPAAGPAPIAYDREPCAHCGMLISEPAFAAQLELEGEDPKSFDDPGCLLRYRAERQPRWRAAWYHHLRDPRWIAEADVAFERVALTPMGYGLGAVDRGSAGSLTLAEAEQHVQTAHAEGADAPH
jgi:copper chaperone NosL